MANASSDQVAEAVSTFYQQYGVTTPEGIDSMDTGGILVLADQYAQEHMPNGLSESEKKDFTDRVIKGIAQVKTNANRYVRTSKAYDKLSENGTKKVANAKGEELQRPVYNPYEGVEGDPSEYDATPIVSETEPTPADTDTGMPARDKEVKDAVDKYLTYKYGDEQGNLDPKKVATIDLNDPDQRREFHKYLNDTIPVNDVDPIDFVGRADAAMEQSQAVAQKFNDEYAWAKKRDEITGRDTASKLKYDPSKGIDYSKGGRETPQTQDQAADTSVQSDPTPTETAHNEPEQSEDEPDFEAVGIKDGRRLAVINPKDVIKSLPTFKESFKGKNLADQINYYVTTIINQQRNGKPSQEAQGYVNRNIPTYDDKSFLDQVVEMAFETSGMGSYETQLAQVFARHDRFKRSFVGKNTVLPGFTFFTRPCLCLTDWNVCANRKLAHLITTDTNAIPFAIKCLLDTKFAKLSDKSGNCPLFDKGNPFLVPLCNAVKSISGFIDPALITETTEGGFFSEDQTYVIGGDRMARTYDLNCTFRDFPGNPILTIVDDWCEYMAGLTDGSLQQYASAINCNRMDYTVSIYRFLMDRTNRYIVRWAKCTGCYPVSPPTGIAMNLNEGEETVNAAAEISVPFKANRIEYDDPIILKEFNMLVRRYAIDAGIKDNNMHAFAHNVASNNFCGVPYVRPTRKGYELLWLARKDKVGELTNGTGENLDAPTFRTQDEGNLDSNTL